MKKLLSILVLLCLCTICLYSCKKDANSPTTSDNHVKLLTTGKWKLETVEYLNDNNMWVPDPNPQDINHITVEYDTDNSFLAVDQYGNSGTGTWKFSSDYSQLALITLVNGNASTYTSKLTILNSTTLQLVPPDGYPVEYNGERDTFIHP